MRSSRYGDSSTSSKNQMPSSIQKSYGVAVSAVTSLAEMRDAGRELAARHGTAFLIKGGHLREAVATDLLILPDGTEHRYDAPFVPGVNTHGTGCTYSAAIATALARGLALPAAVREAKQFVTAAITGFLRWEKDGRTTDALHHFASGE